LNAENTLAPVWTACYTTRVAAPRQTGFDFEAKGASGIDAWRAQLQRQREELAHSLGLPLGKQVEVWLRGGVRLRGRLNLEGAILVHAQSTLQNTRFEVDGVRFSYSEVESCVQY
jgi:hypothetical protein